LGGGGKKKSSVIKEEGKKKKTNSPEKKKKTISRAQSESSKRRKKKRFPKKIQHTFEEKGKKIASPLRKGKESSNFDPTKGIMRGERKEKGEGKPIEQVSRD